MRDVDPWGTVVEIRVHEEPDPEFYPGVPMVAMLFETYHPMDHEPWMIVSPTLYNPGCGEGMTWVGHSSVADWTVVR